MKSKKIAFFTPSLNIGGIERVFMTYANTFANSYDVDYVVCYENGDIRNYLKSNVNCVVLYTRLPYSFFKLVRYIKTHCPDFIITGGDIPNAVAILANILSGSKTKVVISQHNYLNIEQSVFLSKFIYNYIYKFAYKIVSVSEGIAAFISDFKVKKDRVVTICNPINIKEIDNLSEQELPVDLKFTNYILFVGRLSVVKNLAFFITSFSLLKKKNPELNLVLAGEGSMRHSLEELIEKLNLKDSIQFLGVVSNPYPLIRNSLFVALPSFSEALPTIVLETFALGKTLVATPTNGAVDLLKNGKYGFISNSFDNVDEFAKLMTKAIVSDISKLELREYASSFDISIKIKELERLLN